MKAGFKRGCALLCAILLAIGIFVPMQTYAKEQKAKVVLYDNPFLREGPGSTFGVYVENPVKGAKYSATVSDESIAQLVNAGISAYDGQNTFEFYAKKSGTVKITIKQTLNKKTKKIKTLKVTIKSKKFTKKQNEREKLYKRIAKNGSKGSDAGVSLEVLKVTKVKKTENKVSLTLELSHKVTADEAKLAKNGFSAWIESRDSMIGFDGKLKKGSKYVTVTAKKSDMEKGATKKGKVYYLTGLNTKTNSPYRKKITF